MPHIAALIKRKSLIGLSIASMVAVSGCGILDSSGSSQTYQEGYVLDKNALSSISVGSSQEQVILSLGTPSLKTKYDNEVFYYISQTRYRPMQFMKTKIIDRKVLAIYFNKNNQVTKVAHYGLQNGQVFDFITQTTPTATKEQPFLIQIIKGPANLPTHN
ncbi:outer membrane protein assembly factor BamE [Bartonella vinsonii]|uniref:outer membrane protein assembly factor BamE n=1 Tax=Bartonella vinsonii TaxID=33047 RepID=UPI0002B6D876|nr:outer membrane protein assembly factor BamE [Bartonella vinsonii]AGF75919.1 small protein A, outer membrane lipoprotein [Bartonella vinsonii subsp. berkhoffii str. Winnie]